VLEAFGDRKLNDVWRPIGYPDIARGKKSWGVQQRRGFGAAETWEEPKEA
jgi:hypothetical protein